MSNECNATRTFIPDVQHKKIAEVILRLERIHSVIAVAAAALKQQNCELDADIASVLQGSAADRLHEQIETLRELLQK
jgi:hypothetical protein